MRDFCFIFMAMGPRLKNIIAVLCVLVLCAHFGLIINYTHCFSKNNGSIFDRSSAAYAYPFFHQSWQMFVPAPKTNYELYIRTFGNGQWSRWENLFDDKVRRHQANRLSGDELVSLLYASAMAHTYNEENYRIFDTEPEDINFRILNHAVRNDLRFQQQRNFESYEMIVVVKENKHRYSAYYKYLH